MAFSRKRFLYAAAAPLTLGTLLATTAAAPASAHVRPPAPRVATGSMELGNPLQYEQFTALQGFGWYRGSVAYTNWTYAEPGSGVFAPAAGSHAMTFVYQGRSYAHTLNAGLKLDALSTDKLAFSGTGETGSQHWTIRGTVTDRQLSATIVYVGGPSAGYKVFLFGGVAGNGSATGFARSSTGQQLKFSMPPGSFMSVLHYHAAIQSDQIGQRDATFSFTIPKNPGTVADKLAGVKVTVKVHDGGPGARFDKYSHNGASYPITGGPGVTIR